MAADSTAAPAAVEVKFGQVGVASALLRSADPKAVGADLRRRLEAAPGLFSGVPLVLDLSRLPRLPDADDARALLASVRDAGMVPVGLAYGSSANADLARALDVPLFARFRGAPEGSPSAAPTATAAAPASALHHAKSVRSGQQVYARQRDLVVCASVGSGAEVIADGSVHVYGRLGGRAIAGAQGDAQARIYCREFHAELVSIAGHYRVLEDVPAALRGAPVQARLEGDRLVMEKM